MTKHICNRCKNTGIREDDGLLCHLTAACEAAFHGTCPHRPKDSGLCAECRIRADERERVVKVLREALKESIANNIDPDETAADGRILRDFDAAVKKMDKI